MGRKRKRNVSSGDGISRRTVLLGLTGGTVGATGLFYTGAFSSATGNRPFGVSTAGDGNAFFQIGATDPSGIAGDSVTLFDITNGFGAEISETDIEVKDVDNISLDGLTLEPTPLAPGKSGEILGTLSCEGSPGETVQEEVNISITAETEAESVDLTRSVNVECRVPGQSVCESRPLPPRECELYGFPEKNEDTECNVDVKTESVDQKIRKDIGGALRVRASDDIDKLDIGGNASIGGFVRAEGANIGEFKINSNIPSVVQVDASGDIDELIIKSSTDGICATAGGSIDTLEIDSVIGDDIRIDSGGDTGELEIGGTVEGDVTIDSGGAIDELEIDSTVNGNIRIDSGGDIGELEIGGTVEGNVTIDSGGDIDELEIGGTVKGNVTIDSGGDISELEVSGTVEGNVDIDGRGEISIELKANSKISGDLTVNGRGEISIELKGNSEISGDLTIISDEGSDVTLDIKGNGSISGDLKIDTEGDIEFDDCDAVDGEVSPTELC